MCESARHTTTSKLEITARPSGVGSRVVCCVLCLVSCVLCLVSCVLCLVSFLPSISNLDLAIRFNGQRIKDDTIYNAYLMYDFYTLASRKRHFEL